jgi:hypothetical protein
MDEFGMDHSVADEFARSGHPSIQELVAKQGTKFRTDPAELLGDFWSEEESIEESLRALRVWRGHERAIASHDAGLSCISDSTFLQFVDDTLGFLRLRWKERRITSGIDSPRNRRAGALGFILR